MFQPSSLGFGKPSMSNLNPSASNITPSMPSSNNSNSSFNSGNSRAGLASGIPAYQSSLKTEDNSKSPRITSGNSYASGHTQRDRKENCKPTYY